jgi:hypothetical protein
MFEDMRRQYNNTVPKPPDYCEWLKSQSLAAFSGSLQPYVPPREKSASELIAQCQDKGKLAPAAGGAADVSQKLLRDRGRRTLEGCLNCHDTSSMVNGNLTAGTNVFDVDHLKTWLSSKRTGGGDQTWFDRIVAATGHGGKVSMPPNNPLDPESRDTFLGYLSSVMASDDGKGTGFNCEALPSRDTKPAEAAPAAADQKGDSVATPAKVQK